MDKRKERVATIVLLLSLVLVTVGISYAFFTYVGVGSTANTIQTGTLTFVYDEQNKQGNGITLSNALPVSDSVGKIQTGANQVFEFQVLANATGSAISYEVIGEKVDSSTLKESVVKVYLTSVTGEVETSVDTTLKNGVVTTYQDLVNTTVKDQVGKTLYQETIESGSSSYSKTFRLRMWLSDEANSSTDGNWDYNDQSFSMKVNVVANGEEVQLPAYEDLSGANVPELVEGMIPVTYNEATKNWEKADTDSAWYDYSNQMWANAVTVSETNRTTYLSAPPSTPISMDDIETMWVWIPRYEYQYTNLGTQYAGGTQDLPGEIKINFISQNVTSPSDGTNYKVHPAFTFGEKELSGFWYAKFETSGTTTVPMVKPDVNSLRGFILAEMFAAGQKLTASGNSYGLPVSADSHVSKNSEWGAVAYLSQSKYGKYGNSSFSGANKEIYMNNYGEMENYTTHTGCSSGKPSATASSTCAYTYEVPILGTGASTTGTIYGIYDMNGGTWEKVMGNYNNIDGFFDSSRFDTMPDAKYYDLYTTTNSATACNGGICYGHGLSETAGWYGDWQTMVNSDYSWFYRSCSFLDNSGLFGFYAPSDMSAVINGYFVSFRLVITP